MAERSLPTKPEQGAKVTLRKGTGPSKGSGKRAAAPRQSIKGKTLLKPTAKAAAKKAATKAAGRGGQLPPDREHPDQDPGRRAPRSADQYVRLQIHVEDGEFSVVDSHLVDSPLIQDSNFLGSHAYEVTDGERLLYAGSLPDLGTFRSFVHPAGTQEQMRHHIYEMLSYDFDVRVPAAALTRQSLRHIEIALYRVKDRLPDRVLTAAPLSSQFERDLREVGRVVGIPPSILPRGLKIDGRKPRGRD